MPWFHHPTVRQTLIAGAVPFGLVAALLAGLGLYHTAQLGAHAQALLAAPPPDANALGTAIDQQQHYAVWTLIAALGGGLLVAGAVARASARRLTDRVQHLTDTAHQLAHGSLSARINDDTDDALGRLARALHAMRETLADSQEQQHAAQRRAEQAIDETTHTLHVHMQDLEADVTLLLDALERLASGDLTARVPTDRDGAVERLFRGFNEAAARIHDTIHQVTAAADAAAATTEQVHAATDQLATGAEAQSARADEVAAAMDQMRHTIAVNAEAATETAALAEENGTIAQQNGDIILETVEKMEEIADVVTTSAQTVSGLSESAKAIGQIIVTIDEIADQTNLLALNAAIEAARAGEHGKGFAVVADEVRQLAERTVTATGEISAMIRSIQDETDEAAQAMSHGVGIVQAGIQLADHAGQAFEQIVHSAERVGDQTDAIAAASEEQSITSETVSSRVASISTLAQDQAQATSEMTQVMDDLTISTEQMRQRLDQFTLNAPTASAAPAAE